MKRFLFLCTLVIVWNGSFSQVQFTADKLPQINSKIPRGSYLTSSQYVQVAKLNGFEYTVLTITNLSNNDMLSYFVYHGELIDINGVNGLISFFNYFKDTLILQKPLKNITVDYTITTNSKTDLYIRCKWYDNKWKCYIGRTGSWDYLWDRDYNKWLNIIENVRDLIIQNTNLSEETKMSLELIKDNNYINSLFLETY